MKALLLTTILIMAGCAAPVYPSRNHDALSAYEREDASYTLYNATGEIGVGTISLTATSTEIKYEAQIQLHARQDYYGNPLNGRNYTLTAIIDAHTGAITRINQPPYSQQFQVDIFQGAQLNFDFPEPTTHFPWGASAYVPNARDLTVNSGTGINHYTRTLTTDWIPLGIQWPLLKQGEFKGKWGLADVQGKQINSDWMIAAQIPCTENCKDATTPFQITMDGRGPGLLPINYTWRNGAFLAELRQTAHTTSGNAVELTPTPPALPSTSDSPPCNDLPCEANDWPIRISLQTGWLALQAIPQFQAWRATSPNFRVLTASTTQTGLVSEDDAAQRVYYDFVLLSSNNNQHAFQLISPIAAGQAILPIYSTDSDLGSTTTTIALTPNPGLMPLSELVSNMLASENLSLSQVSNLHFSRPTTIDRPTPEGQATLHLDFFGNAPISGMDASFNSGHIQALY